MDNKRIDIIENRRWKPSDILFWKNPEDGVVNAIINYDDKLTRLRASMLIIKNKTEILLCEDETEPGNFCLPGGGIEPNETIVEAAIRETQEEVKITVKNVVEANADYCECHDEVMSWVKTHVAKDHWWYNYYTCLAVGEYDKPFTGKIDKVDLDPKMKNTAKFYNLKDAIKHKSFKASWKLALYQTGYLKRKPVNTKIEEDLKDEAKAYFGTTTRLISGMYINTDGTILDGSGEKFGARGYKRSIDHREVLDGLNDKNLTGYEAMIKYMNEGNIRFIPECYGFNMIKEPTDKQYDTIKYILSSNVDECEVDIDNIFGETITTFNYTYDINHVIPDIKRYFNNIITEDTKSQLLNKSKNAGKYKNTNHGINRYDRKKYIKISSDTKKYNQINMNDLFTQDLLQVEVPVTGETDSYIVTIKLEGVIAEIQKNIKANKNKFEYRTVIQSLTKVYNTSNVYVKCTCQDFKFNFEHFSIINNYGVDDTSKDPGPGKNKANPNNDKGIGCKHILLMLENQDWIMKAANVINNYILYLEKNMSKQFLFIIFPKLYNCTIDAALENGLVQDKKFLTNSNGIIKAIGTASVKAPMTETNTK